MPFPSKPRFRCQAGYSAAPLSSPVRSSKGVTTTITSTKAEHQSSTPSTTTTTTTIPVAIYPARSFGGASLDHLSHVLSAYRPDIDWELWDYSAIDDLLDDLPTYPKGSIVLYRSGKTVSPSLLAHTTPLTLVLSNDLGCQKSLPAATTTSIHAILPTIHDGTQQGLYPFFLLGVKDHEIFVTSQEQPLVATSERSIALSYVGPPPSSRFSFKAMDEAIKGDRKSLESQGRIVYPTSDHVATVDDQHRLEVLGESQLTLVPAEEVVKGSLFVSALEMGSIPVTERVSEYRGCLDPLAWLVESQAPVVFVDDWADLAGTIEGLLADPDALDRQQKALVTWWDSYKKEAVSSLVQHWEDAQQHPLRQLEASDIASKPASKPLLYANPTLLSSSSSFSSSSHLRSGLTEAAISLFFMLSLIVLGHECAQSRYRAQRRQARMMKENDEKMPMILDLTRTPSMSPPQESSPGQSPRTPMMNKTQGGLFFTKDDVGNGSNQGPGKSCYRYSLAGWHEAPTDDHFCYLCVCAEEASRLFLILLPLVYFASSIGIIYFNNWILNSLFPYPATLTMCHMITGAVVAAILVYPLRLFPAPTGLTMRFYISRILPLGILYAINLWGSNSAYLYLVGKKRCIYHH